MCSRKRITERIRNILGIRQSVDGFMMQPEFTNHCNFHCLLCPHSTYGKRSPTGNKFDREKGFMSEELFHVFLNNARQYAKTVVIGFFGEPMLHPEFGNFASRFPEGRNYKLILNTNFSLATKEQMEVLKRFDEVRISMDASNAILYEKLCPGGPILDLEGNNSKDRYLSLAEKVEYWLNLAEHPETRLIYVVSTTNKNDKEVFLDKWLPMMQRQDCVSTKIPLSYGGVMKDSLMERTSCRVPYEKRLTVAWNGDCSPCNLDVNMALHIGNLLKERDLGKILRGKVYRKVLRAMEKKEGICGNCLDGNNNKDNVDHWGQKNIECDP